MSRQHPVIAVTGSSGAGTTFVKRAFENIFRREKIKATIVEGDSFHSVTRAEFKERSKTAPNFSHFGLKPMTSTRWKPCSKATRRDRKPARNVITCTMTRKPDSTASVWPRRV
ncbi:MAG: hypothetical protein R3E89_19095 [Thiolinea sp.]